MDLSLSLLLIRFTAGLLLMGHGAQKLVGIGLEAEAVADALDEIPPQLTAAMDNVVVLVADRNDAELARFHVGHEWWRAGRGKLRASCDKVDKVGASALVRHVLDVDTAHQFQVFDREMPRASVPGTANGRLLQAGQKDVWRFAAKKGARLALETNARRLGSP